ncbi:MAG: lipoyl synthase [Halanaerobiales bacterium]
MNKQFNNDKKPVWLRKRIRLDGSFQKTEELLKTLHLNTVCQSAQCPNIGECFSQETATFMIMGNICTRNCRFCDLKNDIPEEVNNKEPDNIVKAVEKLNLKHVVITSVTRDDLKDHGSGHFAKVLNKLRSFNPSLTLEVLTPDFQGEMEYLEKVLKASPDVFNHNIETVPNLYKLVRPEANYQRSLEVLKYAKSFNKKLVVKSGFMLGLGEKKKEVIDLMKDLVKTGVDILTIGQYLQPSSQHLKVEEYISPENFKELKDIAKELGFNSVVSGVFVRSSFQAKESYQEVISKRKEHII